FFFQAEDGIRDFRVTGVQTCALPIFFEVAHPSLGYSLGGGGRYDGMIGRFLGTDVPATGFSLGFERLVDLVELPEDDAAESIARSEERRGGKDCTCAWHQVHVT